MSALTSYLGIPPAQEQSLHGRKHTERISANSSEGGKEGGESKAKYREQENCLFLVPRVTSSFHRKPCARQTKPLLAIIAKLPVSNPVKKMCLLPSNLALKGSRLKSLRL